MLGDVYLCPKRGFLLIQGCLPFATLKQLKPGIWKIMVLLYSSEMGLPQLTCLHSWCLGDSG